MENHKENFWAITLKLFECFHFYQNHSFFPAYSHLIPVSCSFSMFNFSQMKSLLTLFLLTLLEVSLPYPSSGRDGPIYTGALSELHDCADHSSAHVAACQILSGGMNCSVWSENMWRSWPP